MPTSSSSSSRNDKVRNILTGCEDLLNDFSLPEEHDSRHRSGHENRFVSIDLDDNVDSVTSSPTITPGSIVMNNNVNFASQRATATATATIAGGTKRGGGGQTSNKRAWERAIDRYVANVLEEVGSSDSTVSGGGGGGGGGGRGSTRSFIANAATGGDGGGSSRSGRKKSHHHHRVHPDNHLLDALRIETASASSIPHVKSDGKFDVDDTSFEPIDPYDFDRRRRRGGATTHDDDDNDDCGGGRNSKFDRARRRMRQYLREEWKPISLIVLVILLTVIVSSITSGGGGGGDGERGNVVDDDEHSINVVADPSMAVPEGLGGGGGGGIVDPAGDGVVVDSHGDPSLVVDATAYPTFYPTTRTMANTATPSGGGDVPTYDPTSHATTSSPSSSPSAIDVVVPTSRPASGAPSMPAKYDEMRDAAKYVSGGKGFDVMFSPQNLAFDWLYREGNPSTNLLEFFEQYAVAVVYFSLTRARTIGVGNEYVFDEWIRTKEICGWEGVRCAFNYTSEMVHVTDIILSNKNLTGRIPNEIAFLPKVKRLDLSDNKITGTVPSGVYGMKRLR
jgi:hypothetical protein